MGKITGLAIKRNAARTKVAEWMTAERRAGRERELTDAPAWDEFIAAYNAVENALYPDAVEDDT